MRSIISTGIPAKRSLVSVSIISLQLLSASVSAVTVATWNGSTGNWSDAARWNTAIVPNNGSPGPLDTYDAIINGGTVNLNLPVSLANFYFNGGTLNSTTNQALSTTGIVRLAGGIVAGGTLTANGGLEVTNGLTMNGTGIVANNGANGKWTTVNRIDMNNTAQFNNNAGATFDIQSDSTTYGEGFLFIGGTPSINNAGLWKKSAGPGDFTSQVAFNNTGSVEVSSGTFSSAAKS